MVCNGSRRSWAATDAKRSSSWLLADRRAFAACSCCSASRRSLRSRVTLPKPTRGAAGVPQRGDDDAGPEGPAVLAHAPALLLEAAVARGDLQLVGRMVARTV